MTQPSTPEANKSLAILGPITFNALSDLVLPLA
jgi:hypothetical protein